MPKVRKQKVHLNRAHQQRAEKRQKTRETESQNPVVIEQPEEDLPSTSGVGSHVQESGSSSESDSR